MVSVHISGRLSGTVQSASVAADAVDGTRVRVVDSRHVSVGLGLVVQAAGEAMQAGDRPLDAVVAAAEAAARATRVYGALPELDVAVKGGRVSAPAAMLAGLMDLKPLIVFDEEGATHIAGARLGYRRALQAVADKVVRYAAGDPVRAVIVHADGLESAQSVHERLSASARRRRHPLSAGRRRHHHPRGSGHRRGGRADVFRQPDRRVPPTAQIRRHARMESTAPRGSRQRPDAAAATATCSPSPRAVTSPKTSGRS